MNLGEIFNYIKNINEKDDRGGIITPVEFQEFIVNASDTFFDSELEKYRVTRKAPETLEHLVYTDPISVTAGTGTLTDYLKRHPVSASYLYDGKIRDIDLLDQKEYNKRLSTSILYPTASRPISTSYRTALYITPTITGTVNYNYIRTANKPFFDYYYKNGVTITYIEPGTTFVANVSNPYRTGATSGSFPSQSVEFEFKASSIPYLLNILLTYYGLKIPENMIYNDSIQKQIANTQNP